MHDELRPLAVQVQIVGRTVQIPVTDAGRSCAYLGEFQSLGAEKPLHVGGAGAQLHGADDLRS